MKPLSLLYKTFFTLLKVLLVLVPGPIKYCFGCNDESTMLCPNTSKKCWSRLSSAVGLGLRFLTLRLIGPLLLLMGNTLICSAMAAFIIYFLPELSQGKTFLYVCHLILGTFIFINVIFNYLLCAFSCPGYPSKCSKLLIESKTFRVVDDQKVSCIPSRIDVMPGVSYRYCKICECIKPPRTHHDRYVTSNVILLDYQLCYFYVRITQLGNQ